jgi:hypothetical protein
LSTVGVEWGRVRTSKVKLGVVGSALNEQGHKQSSAHLLACSSWAEACAAAGPRGHRIELVPPQNPGLPTACRAQPLLRVVLCSAFVLLVCSALECSDDVFTYQRPCPSWAELCAAPGPRDRRTEPAPPRTPGQAASGQTQPLLTVVCLRCVRIEVVSVLRDSVW